MGLLEAEKADKSFDPLRLLPADNSRHCQWIIEHWSGGRKASGTDSINRRVWAINYRCWSMKANSQLIGRLMILIFKRTGERNQTGRLGAFMTVYSPIYWLPAIKMVYLCLVTERGRFNWTRRFFTFLLGTCFSGHTPSNFVIRAIYWFLIRCQVSMA